MSDVFINVLKISTGKNVIYIYNPNPNPSIEGNSDMIKKPYGQLKYKW